MDKIKETIERSMMTTSKQLLWTIVVFFFMCVIATGIVDVIFDKDLSYLIGYVSPLAILVIPTYSAKSFFENKEKFSNSIEQESEE